MFEYKFLPKLMCVFLSYCFADMTAFSKNAVITQIPEQPEVKSWAAMLYWQPHSLFLVE